MSTEPTRERPCCAGPLADGRHFKNCVQRCWDCKGDPDGPNRCKCGDPLPDEDAQ